MECVSQYGELAVSFCYVKIRSMQDLVKIAITVYKTMHIYALVTLYIVVWPIHGRW